MTARATLLAGIAALLAMPAAAQDTTFRLPPGPTPTPTPPPVIGPVLGTPTPSPTPRPAPSPTPSAVPTATPTLVAPSATRVTIPAVPSPTPAATRRPAPGATPTPSPAATATQPAPIAVPTIAPNATPAPAQAAPLPTSAPVGPSVAVPAEKGRSYWPWVVFVFLLAGAGFGALYWLRRRLGPLGPIAVPEIERPRVPPPPAADPLPLAAEPAPEPPPAPATPVEEPPAAAADPLQIAIELRKLTITMMNAALSYRLTLTNGGAEPLEEIAVAADLVGAHSSLPRDAQLAGPATELPQRHRLAGIAPGESGEVTGELRLPLHELRPITQGRAALFVPLARFRIGAQGREPRCFTLVAGQPSPSGNGALQPVRLDLGPRIYDGLAGRAF